MDTLQDFSGPTWMTMLCHFVGIKRASFVWLVHPWSIPYSYFALMNDRNTTPSLTASQQISKHPPSHYCIDEDRVYATGFSNGGG